MAWARGRSPASCSYPSSVSFSFLDPDHAERLTACKISLPVATTPAGAPVAGGLYDPLMGPLDPLSGPCGTCGLLHSRCPGHCGRIELPLPVIHPLAAAEALKVLRATCFKCYHFRKAEHKRKGIDKAVDLRQEIKSAEAEKVKAHTLVDNITSDQFLRSTRRRVLRKRLSALGRIKASRISKCEHCGAHSPTIKKDGPTRFSLAALPAKQAQENLANGHALQILIGDGDEKSSGNIECILMGEEHSLNVDFRKSRMLTPLEIEKIFERVWVNERRTCGMIWPTSRAGNAAPSPYFMFIRTLVVPPNKFRPPSYLDGRMYENVQNTHYSNILDASLKIKELTVASNVDGQSFDKLIASWLEMQDAVNSLIDSAASERSGAAKEASPGIRQQLDRKEGLFRKNMMGKRVNYAARSVISPDPLIATSEIGVPPFFAMRLSYPEAVLSWNVQSLRQLVENGSNTYPGALAVEDEQGKVINLASLSLQQRKVLAARLMCSSVTDRQDLSNADSSVSGHAVTPKFKVVYRHMKDGDIMLVNRQPTLHKPGIMAHTVRVINTGQRTIRLHYANCSTYNADFDGDEINLHLPQDVLSRAEGYGIVSADEQYVSPTAGAPLRGLIQDHVVGAVLLTKRDTFFTREEYVQLLFVACGHVRGDSISTFSASNKQCNRAIPVSKPAIFRPVCRWSGKQVLEEVVRFIAAGLPPITFTSGTKVPAEYWGNSSHEDTFCFVDGHLVHGVFDKAQFGSYGLVHAVHELYGPKAAGELLSALSRLMTCFLQWHGMTCGLDDMMIKTAAEKERLSQLERADEVAAAAIANFVLQGKAETPPKEMESKLTCMLQDALLRRPEDEATLDMKASSCLNPITSSIIKSCIPQGQLKVFPDNCLSLMTMSGAKGSLVNFSQISCLLGQQELEGRRVPRMPSGKTLPCFQPWDMSARSGGFIGDRFLTGLKPQEYYFHCMAGRDGLVDTTVKTSRSGYLQRCLVKNLETLVIQYDHTVRDCDGSIIQFQYGEDALDPAKVPYLSKFSFVLQNSTQASHNVGMDGQEWTDIDSKVDNHLAFKDKENSLPPLAEDFPTFRGAVSEYYQKMMRSYLESDPDNLLLKHEVQKRNKTQNISPEHFAQLMELRYMQSLAAPGESVGVIAAQSIGEPSTQMTLNTFHFAGRGEANVTLGIPRLREILMVASQNMKTPIMSLPLLETEDRSTCCAAARELVLRYRKVRLAEVLMNMEVLEFPCARNGTAREYRIQLEFHEEKDYCHIVPIPFQKIAEVFKNVFCGQVRFLLSSELRKSSSKGLRAVDSSVFKSNAEENKEGLDSLPEDGEQKKRRVPILDDEEEEEDEGMEEGDEESAKEAHRDALRNPSYQDPDDEEPSDAIHEKHAFEERDPIRIDGSDDAHPKNELESMEIDETNRRCRYSLFVPVDAPKLLVLEIAEKAAVRSVLSSTVGIEKAMVVGEDMESTYPVVQTEGVNLQSSWEHQDLVDVHNVRTNDIHAMLQTYGVEAARASIALEVKSVFDAYGIRVDDRHLSLISDFMTVDGTYRAFSRLGIQDTSSPILKMSFETATKFLVDASLHGEIDRLRSPSARISLGQVVELGTGLCDVFLDLIPTK